MDVVFLFSVVVVGLGPSAGDVSAFSGFVGFGGVITVFSVFTVVLLAKGVFGGLDSGSRCVVAIDVSNQW